MPALLADLALAIPFLVIFIGVPVWALSGRKWRTSGRTTA